MIHYARPTSQAGGQVPGARVAAASSCTHPPPLAAAGCRPPAPPPLPRGCPRLPPRHQTRPLQNCRGNRRQEGTRVNRAGGGGARRRRRQRVMDCRLLPRAGTAAVHTVPGAVSHRLRPSPGAPQQRWGWACRRCSGSRVWAAAKQVIPIICHAGDTEGPLPERWEPAGGSLRLGGAGCGLGGRLDDVQRCRWPGGGDV